MPVWFVSDSGQQCRLALTPLLCYPYFLVSNSNKRRQLFTAARRAARSSTYSLTARQERGANNIAGGAKGYGELSHAGGPAGGRRAAKNSCQGGWVLTVPPPGQVAPATPSPVTPMGAVVGASRAILKASGIGIEQIRSNLGGQAARPYTQVS